MLITVSELIGKSWQDYKKNLHEWMIFAALIFAPNFILVMAGSFGGFLSEYAPWTGLPTDLIIIILILLSIFSSFWSSLALAHAVGTYITRKRSDHWKEHYAAVLPLLWPAFITGVIVTITLTAGVILFIIPGIIFLVWYSFTGYRVLFENESGLRALRESKKLVAGRWWEVAWRLFVFMFLSSLIFSVAFFIVGVFTTFLPVSEDVASITLVVSHFVLSSIFLIPITTLGALNLYFNLKENPIRTK